ncbi:MAG: lipoyl(octanoyl) transferase LipB [Chloroflexota bacterium]
MGTTDYQEAWDFQRWVARARRDDLIPDVVLFLEHPHTFTLGRRGRRDNILLTERQMKRRGIAVYDVDRGGDVTYHGPEQLVGYPVLKLPGDRSNRVHYIRTLELALVRAVCDLGVHASLQEGLTGVWVEDAKICALGAKIDAYGVTTHGFALNVNTDLSYFGHIVPCGLHDKGVTSLQQVLGGRVPMRRVRDMVARHIASTFDRRPIAIGRRRLTALIEKNCPHGEVAGG